jgi:amino acid transporter
VWVLPVALAGQCLLLGVYYELAAKWPLSNGAYQWTRRLIGPRYGWMTGWVALCAYAVANTTIAYLGAPWALTLLGITPTAHAIVITGAILVLVCSLVNAVGVDALKAALRLGVAAEAVASVGIGLALLLVFREQSPSVLFDTFGAEALSGGSTFAALLAALAVAGWAFIGFDSTVAAAEETKGAAKHVPRAVWIALLSVGALVILNAFATTLAHPNPADVTAGKDIDPVSTAVVSNFGDWSSKPFAAVVLLAFIACGMAAQGGTSRGIYSVARDGVLPGSSFLRKVSANQAPIGGIVATTVVAWLGLLLGLEATAIGSLITFGTAAIYCAFLLVAIAALYARSQGVLSRSKPRIVVNVAAVLWLGFETINVAWPRASLAPVGAPWYQIWAAPMVVGAIVVFGLLYLFTARPTDGH